MYIISITVLVLCVIYMVYRIILYIIRSRKNNKCDDKIAVKKNTLDERFYSTPSFDFPNTQSELELKDIDCSSEPIISGKLEMKDYCKYVDDWVKIELLFKRVSDWYDMTILKALDISSAFNKYLREDFK